MIIDKGYPHPLYSLTLQSNLDTDEDTPAIATPAGFLSTSAALRARAAHYGSALVEQAAICAVVLCRRRRADFAPFGFTLEWADNMAAWCQELGREQWRLQVACAGARWEEAQLAALGDTGKRLWGLLRTAGALAGHHVIRGSLPRSMAEQSAALRQTAAQVRPAEIAEALARYGFGPAQQAEWQALIEEREATWLRRRECLAAQRDHQRRGLVIRAALMGDVSRFCLAAAQVLPPALARRMRMNRWFS